MIVVAIESTGAVASVAAAEDGVVIGTEVCSERKRHSETLLPLLDDLLMRHGHTLKDVDLFCVDIGPGSFTGVRIGTASVNAIARSTGKQVMGISSLDALYAHEGFPENALVLLDAGAGRAFAAFYRGGKREGEPMAGSKDHLVSMAAKDAVLIDGGIPHAEDLLKAAERFGRGASSAKPLYIVPSQAERMLLLRTSGKTEGII